MAIPELINEADGLGHSDWPDLGHVSTCLRVRSVPLEIPELTVKEGWMVLQGKVEQVNNDSDLC